MDLLLLTDRLYVADLG